MAAKGYNIDSSSSSGLVNDINTTIPATATTIPAPATTTVPTTHHTDNEHTAASILLSLQNRPVIATTIAVLDTATPSHIATTMYGADEYEPSPEDFERRIHVNLTPSAAEGPIKAVTATPTNAVFEIVERARKRIGE
ncbi:MAG: hypothetical protein Q9226_006314, partial [Calogaya cf. arnoldii]